MPSLEKPARWDLAFEFIAGGRITNNPFNAGILAGALLHLSRYRFALVDDQYGQTSDDGFAGIDCLVDFTLND